MAKAVKKAKSVITDASMSFFKNYINNASPVGFESSGQKLWMNYLRPFADEFFTDPYGTAVAVINPTSTSTIGSYDWQGAETAGSEWHVASVDGGQWLIVVENKKTTHDTVEKILNSIAVK